MHRAENKVKEMLIKTNKTVQKYKISKSNNCRDISYMDITVKICGGKKMQSYLQWIKNLAIKFSKTTLNTYDRNLCSSLLIRINHSKTDTTAHFDYWAICEGPQIDKGQAKLPTIIGQLWWSIMKGLTFPITKMIKICLVINML